MNKIIYTLFVILGFALSCKNQSNKYKDQKHFIREDNETLEVELPQTVPDCVFKDEIELVLKTNNSFELLFNINSNSNSFKEELKINLKDLDFINTEVSSAKIECYKNSFALKYIEQLGNNYSTTHHVFELDDKTKKPVWSKIYRIETTRQGFEIYGAIVDNEDISIYDGNENLEGDLLSIYSFNGFQEEKEPTINAFHDITKANKSSKKDLSLICDITVLNCITENISLDKNSLSQFNDIAYYLEQENLNEEAIVLLETIIKKFPNRIPAYINLGDAFWKLGLKAKSKKAYQTYVKLTGDKKKIPKRVLDRID